MKQSYLFISLCCIVVAQSCTTYSPRLRSATSGDYNQRVIIQKPEFKRTINPKGIAVTATSTAAGAYAGYNVDIIKFNGENHQTQTNKPLNAVVGGLIGYGLASAGNYLLAKQGQTVSLSKGGGVDEWIKKHNKKYIYLYGNEQSLTLIHENAEQNYSVKNFQDCKDFAKAFPLSVQTDKVVDNALAVLPRSELPDLLKTFPQTSRGKEVAIKYIQLSQSTMEAVEASNLYPNHSPLAEEKAFQLIKSVNDATLFFNRFKQSTYAARIETTILPLVQNISEAQQFLKFFPSSQYKRELQRNIAPKVASMKDLEAFVVLFPDKAFLPDAITALRPKLSRIELSMLIVRYPTESFTRDLKNYYISNALDVAEVLEAANLYPDHSLDIDQVASGKIRSPLDGDLYLRNFKKGKNRPLVQTKMKDLLKDEYAYMHSTKDKYNFYEKYQNLVYDPDNILKRTYAELESLEAKYQRVFEDIVEKKDLPNSDQLVYIVYETHRYPAYVAADIVEKAAQVIDIIGPWVKYIHLSGASDTYGILVGEWYKEGIDGDILGAFSNELKQFEAKSKKLAQANFEDLIKYQAIYKGSRASDIRGRQAWRDAFSAGFSGGSAPKKSTPSSSNGLCGSVTSTFNDSECGVAVKMHRVKCDNGTTFNMYLWSKDLEKKCMYTVYVQDGYYKSTSLERDDYLGTSETLAIKKGCNCK